MQKYKMKSKKKNSLAVSGVTFIMNFCRSHALVFLFFSSSFFARARQTCFCKYIDNGCVGCGPRWRMPASIHRLLHFYKYIHIYTHIHIHPRI